jgi:hypothetical protein
VPAVTRKLWRPKAAAALPHADCLQAAASCFQHAVLEAVCQGTRRTGHSWRRRYSGCAPVKAGSSKQKFEECSEAAYAKVTIYSTMIVCSWWLHGHMDAPDGSFEPAAAMQLCSTACSQSTTASGIPLRPQCISPLLTNHCLSTLVNFHMFLHLLFNRTSPGGYHLLTCGERAWSASRGLQRWPPSAQKRHLLQKPALSPNGGHSWRTWYWRCPACRN